MDAGLTPLTADGLRQFRALKSDAANVVTERFYALHGPAYAYFGPRGREACREDLAFHLEFLEPVIEFGLLQPFVDYLHWLASVLAARAVPVDHVALSLDLLGEFFTEHLDTADGAQVVAALNSARAQFTSGQTVPPVAPSPPNPWPEAAEFEAALLAGHQRDALAIISRCIDGGRSLVEAELHVVQPSLYHIGELWRANRITVAKEHLATAIAQSVMTMGLLQTPPAATIGKGILLACVAENDHALGLRMVADAFQFAGWDIEYLGANVPTSAIVRHAEECKPDLVGISVSFPQQLRTVKETIAQLSDHFGADRPAVMIGGLAINQFDRLAEMVGADAWSADAQSAVVRANQLIGG